MLVPLGAHGSGAAFVASATNAGASVATAADFDTVRVTLADPGTPRRAPVRLTATATSDRGVAWVRFERSNPGADQWTTLCTDTTAPYECDWSGDGVYDVRAYAQDSAGYWHTDTVAARRIDAIAPTVTLANPGSALSGSVRLTTTASDSGSGLSRFTLEYRPAGGAWQEVCHSAGTCDWNTGSLPDGDYELRATAEDAAGNSNQALRTGLHVDNTVPTATVPSLPTQVSGMILLSPTISDAGGIKSVVYEGRPVNTGPWYAFYSRTQAPWSYQLDTAPAPDGTYEGRVVVTDAAGNVTTSATGSTTIDNHAPTVTFNDPGATLRGTVTLRATADDGHGSGVASVTFQRQRQGTSGWSTICTGTAVQCTWATTAADDGRWNLQVVVTDGVDKTTTVALTDRTVDNTAPSASDVQGTNGGVAGTLDAGDALTLTWSEAMSPATILAGWSGTQTPVAVKLADGGDKLSVYDAAKNTPLGLDVALGADVVDADAWFRATMTASGTGVTIVLTSPDSGTVKAAGGTPRLVWTPSAAAKDLAGNPCSTTAATETGPDDQDF